LTVRRLVYLLAPLLIWNLMISGPVVAGEPTPQARPDNLRPDFLGPDNLRSGMLDPLPQINLSEPADQLFEVTDLAASDPDPRILSPRDADLYREIFAAQKDGNWKTADRAVRKLDNPILMGHVRRQRFMHPTDYRSRYQELAGWLKGYPDHPGARRIYKLARKRKPANARSPHPPTPTIGHYTGGPADNGLSQHRQPQRGAKSLRKARNIKGRIKGLLRHDRITSASDLLDSAEARQSLSEKEFDNATGAVAAAYYYYGLYDKALVRAATLDAKQAESAAIANWIAGLSSWRAADYRAAARFFESLARSSTSPWLRSAGAYWAARSHLVNRAPESVNKMLEAAANETNTFYGLLAAAQLGYSVDFSWEAPPLREAVFNRLVKYRGVRRAIALVQAGQYFWAEQELKLIRSRASFDEQQSWLTQGLLGLSVRLNMAGSQIPLAEAVAKQGNQTFRAALYPLPDWAPEDGYRLDQALIYAFIRQESRFSARAKSGVGARGLMQLMPRTASFIGRDRSLRWRNKYKLFEPGFNMSLGQRYLEHLMAEKVASKGMLHMTASYNGGPGNVRKWDKRSNHGGDPLLFIESIPSRETRNFVERVMTNLWIYRDRKGQNPVSLWALAAGNWPTYYSQDGKQIALGERLGSDSGARFSTVD